MPITDAQSLSRIRCSEAISALLSIEGGEACSGSLDILDTFKQLGVRMMTLLWNYENEIGYPANDPSAVQKKLKPFGRACVDFMCRNNLCVDVSHLNIGGFWDTCERSTKPILASHSNAYALCPHPRNLNDDQIRAIIQSNGFIGLNFFADFLCDERPCEIKDIIRHARHILTLGGENVLGFGSDFDGISRAPTGICGAQSFPSVVKAFEDAGLGGELLDKISYGNFVRYLSGFLAKKEEASYNIPCF